jgi:SAM-dependent methyltransferase
MRPDYKKINKKFWNREYHAPNVESFIFRLKPNLLDLYINPKKKLKVLDYGCGEGSNINHFIKTYKYDGYGVDVSEPSIKYCKKNINSKKFKLIDFDVKKDDNFFDQKFDLILSIQVLYFLSDEDLKNRLISLNKMLKPGGYVFFTMQSIKNDYFKLFSNKKKNTDGLYKVDLSSDKNYKNRQKQEIYHHYINYVKNEKNLKSKFKLFKPLNIGFYDLALKNTKDSAHHFTFFGKKR